MSAEPLPSAPPIQRLRLRGFEIAGFRSFRKQVTLEFAAEGKEPDEVVVFHGPNGSGKSAAIAAMELLVNGLATAFQYRWDAEPTARRYGKEGAFNVAPSDFVPGTPLQLLVGILPGAGARVGIAASEKAPEQSWRFVVPAAAEAAWFAPTNLIRTTINGALRPPPQRVHEAPVPMRVLSARRRTQGESLHGSPGPLSVHLLEKLYGLRTSLQPYERRRWKSFERVFRLLPTFEQTEISVEQNFGGTAFPAMTFEKHDRLRTHDELSSGEQQFIALCANVLLANAPIVAIEEPELSLDRDNQVLFLAVLRDLIREGALDQVFIESHSPYFDGPEVLRFGRDRDGSSTVQRVPGGNSGAESAALRAKATERGAKQQWVTPEGFTQLPEEMRDNMGIKQGGHVWFLKANRWEAWREDELQAYLDGDDSDEER